MSKVADKDKERKAKVGSRGGKASQWCFMDMSLVRKRDSFVLATNTKDEKKILLIGVDSPCHHTGSMSLDTGGQVRGVAKYRDKYSTSAPRVCLTALAHPSNRARYVRYAANARPYQQLPHFVQVVIGGQNGEVYGRVAASNGRVESAEAEVSGI